MDLDRTSKITKGTDFIESHVDDELVLMDMGSGKFFKLADTGRKTWELIDRCDSYGAILDALREEYDVSEENCRSDTDVLIGQLLEKSLVSVS